LFEKPLKNRVVFFLSISMPQHKISGFDRKNSKPQGVTLRFFVAKLVIFCLRYQNLLNNEDYYVLGHRN